MAQALWKTIYHVLLGQVVSRWSWMQSPCIEVAPTAVKSCWFVKEHPSLLMQGNWIHIFLSPRVVFPKNWFFLYLQRYKNLYLLRRGRNNSFYSIEDTRLKNQEFLLNTFTSLKKMADPRLKNIRIQTGVIKRYVIVIITGWIGIGWLHSLNKLELIILSTQKNNQSINVNLQQ